MKTGGGMLVSRMSVAMVAAFVLAVFVGNAGTTGSSRYFPETGKAAIHQRALDLSGGTEVLAFALEPGSEDLPLLAYLRMAMGARVTVVYVTNGEATPNDNGAWNPAETAGERKKEALAVGRFLDINIRFLNLPDPGVVASPGALRKYWDADTARARMQHMLLYFRPNVLLLGGDMRGDTVRSIRSQVFAKLAGDAIRTAKKSGVHVARVLSEAEWSGRGSTERSYDQKHPVWRVSYRAIATEASRKYMSLRVQRGAWMRRGDRHYTPVGSSRIQRPQSIVAGLPVVGDPIRSLGNMIRKLTARKRGNTLVPDLREVIRAVDSLDVRLARGKSSIGDDNFHLLAVWKNGLEMLRCSLLGAAITYAASDSVLAASQLFYLNFEGLSSGFSRGQTTRIYFPGAIDHTWGVNESTEYQFAFQPPQQFRVLTPQNLEYSYPLAQYGINQAALETRFYFIIVHNDSLPGKRFVYRGNVPFLAAPKRTFEILRPVVRAVNGAPVICRMVDISRDTFHGALTMAGNIVDSVSKRVVLRGKDDLRLDTLELWLRKPLPPGDYPVTVSLPGGVSEQVTARSFDLRTDTSAHVVLVTPSEKSPLGQALDQMSVTWQRVGTGLGTVPDLSKADVIMIDRDALADVRPEGLLAQAIMAWVRAGGRLVVFPQSNVEGGGGSIISGVSFRGSPLLPPDAPLRIDSSRSLLRSVNILSKDDWEGWSVARSFCSVRVATGRGADVIVSSSARDVPLVVTVPEEKGEVTFVALDLISQLIRVHPGGFRLFANLIATRR
jgi:hypothetical protein